MNYNINILKLIEVNKRVISVDGGNSSHAVLDVMTLSVHGRNHKPAPWSR